MIGAAMLRPIHAKGDQIVISEWVEVSTRPGEAVSHLTRWQGVNGIVAQRGKQVNRGLPMYEKDRLRLCRLAAYCTL